MANKCSLTCNVRGSDGKVKVSALWDGLIKFFRQDRKNSVIHYFLSKDSTFLSENSDILEFDTDGEVTLDSLRDALIRDGKYEDLSDGMVLTRLNEQLKNEVGKEYLDYSVALDNVLKFNKSDQFRKKFMAILRPTETGKYTIEVVKRNPSDEYKLSQYVRDKLVTDALRTILRNKGLDIEFVNHPNIGLKYSTYTDYMIDGYRAIGQVLNGIHTSEKVAEIAGHFAVSVMKDSESTKNLIDRLLEQLTPEVQVKLFKDKNSELYREDFFVSDTSAEEAAGILLGRELVRPFKEADASGVATKVKYVIKGVKNLAGIKWLVKKAVSAVMRLFGNEDPYLVDKLSKKAEAMAAEAANGFIANAENLDGDVAFSDKNKKAYAHGTVSKHLSEDVRRNVKAFYSSLNDLKDTLTKIKPIVRRSGEESDRQLRDKMKELIKDVAGNIIPELNLSVYAERKSIEGIVTILHGVTAILDKDVRRILDRVQPADRVNSYTNVSYNARNMKLALTAISNILVLYDTISKKLNTLNPDVTAEALKITDTEGHVLYTSLREAVDKLGDVLLRKSEDYVDIKNGPQKAGGLQGLIEAKMQQVFIDAYSNFFGRDYIERNAGVIWYQKSIGGKRRLLRSDSIEGYNRKDIRDLIETLENDISIIDRYICSASDCGDFVTAVGDKVVKEANMYADRVAFRFWDRIEEIRLQMEEAFGHSDCRVFYETIEVDVNGKKRTVLSGNLLDKVNHGAWEADMEEFKRQLKEEWRQHIRKEEQEFYKARSSEGDRFMVYAPSDNELAIKYHMFADEKWERWHSEHSQKEWVAGGKRYVPNETLYKSQQWIDTFGTDRSILPGLTDEEIAAREKKLKVYNKIRELKDDMDTLLAKNAAVAWRAPQMTGRFGHRFRNLKQKFGWHNPVVAGSLIKRECEDLFVVRPEDAWIFGSNETFNEVEEDPLENYNSVEREKLERLPVYGINKLKNMDDLSTDLFGTLLRYGSMAASYNAMERVVDVFELGRDVLQSRDKAWKLHTNKSTESRAYSRYIKFLEKGVYQIGVTIPNMIFNKDARKLLTNLSTIGGRILLYGNFHGGVVNTGTGFIEIAKEAMAGENCNISEVVEAHKMFFNGIAFNIFGDKYGRGTFYESAWNGLTNAQRPVDKNALWIRYWNILSENRSFLHNQDFDTRTLSLIDNRLGEWFNHTMMLPYSSGDYYMQTIPYYAMGIHEKVYDHSGNEMRLIDAYDIVEGEAVHPVDDDEGPVIGKTPRKLQRKEGIFRSREDIIDYDTVQGMLTKIANFQLNNSKAKDNDPVGLNLFNAEEVRLLEKFKFALPEKVKQLGDLKRALVSKSNNLLYNESDEAAFMLKCRNICNRLHGIYNSEDKVALQQNLYGNLVMSMRGYALGMYNRRYSENKYNVPQMKSVEGSSNTFFKVLCYAFSNIDKMDNWQGCAEAMLFAIPPVNLFLFSDSYGERVKADMMRAGFSEHQYYNVRRFGADYLAIELILLGKLLTSPGMAYGLRKESEDDEDKGSMFNTIKGIMYYLLSRWNREQQAFSTPWGLREESPSLLDYLPAGLSGFMTFLELIDLFARTKIDQRAESGMSEEEIIAHRKQNKLYWQRKENGHEKYEAKYKEKFMKLLPYIRTYYVWFVQSPYKSASAYDNGRKMRGK